jgi:hypothetical protein
MFLNKVLSHVENFIENCFNECPLPLTLSTLRETCFISSLLITRIQAPQQCFYFQHSPFNYISGSSSTGSSSTASSSTDSSSITGPSDSSSHTTSSGSTLTSRSSQSNSQIGSSSSTSSPSAATQSITSLLVFTSTQDSGSVVTVTELTVVPAPVAENTAGSSPTVSASLQPNGASPKSPSAKVMLCALGVVVLATL